MTQVHPYVPWAGDMVPRKTGPGKRIERSGGGGFSSNITARLEWVSREKDAKGSPLQTRKPKGIRLFFPAMCFLAAGLPYFGLSMLAAHQEKDNPWARDLYGRNVLVLTERFPCFDSADYRNEDRYFRWYLLYHNGKFTCVYHTDGTPIVTVTEDVRDLEDDLWRQIQELECFGPEDMEA